MAENDDFSDYTIKVAKFYNDAVNHNNCDMEEVNEVIEQPLIELQKSVFARTDAENAALENAVVSFNGACFSH
jgi:hypothetical protein